MPYACVSIVDTVESTRPQAQIDVGETHSHANQDASEAVRMALMQESMARYRLDVFTRHETFRDICIGLAQRMHRAELGLRTRLLGEPAVHVRPLSETRCALSLII